MFWVGKEWCNLWLLSSHHHALSHSILADLGQPLDPTNCWAIKQGAERCGSTGACLNSEVGFVQGPLCLMGLALARMMTSRSHSTRKYFWLVFWASRMSRLVSLAVAV